MLMNSYDENEWEQHEGTSNTLYALKNSYGGGQTLTEPVGWLFQGDTRIHIPTGASFLNDTH